MKKIIIYILFMILNSLVLFADAQEDEKAKSQFYSIIVNDVPTQLCTKKQLYVQCYKVDEAECKNYMTLFLKSCYKSYESKITADLTLNEIGNYGNNVGSCAGTLYDMFLSQAGVSDKECLKKWDDKIISDNENK
jgi:hypothetical protein